MTHPLDQSIDRIRSAARRIALCYGIGLSLAALVGGLLLVGLLDYYLRVEFVPLRIFLSLAVLLATAVAVFRFLLPALRLRPTEVAVAQRLQDRFPELGDKLASAVEFLRQPEESATAGSAMLRRAVIVDATVDVKKLNLREVLDPRPMQKALLAAGLGLLILTAIALAWPDLARIGFYRVANPLGSAQWPRTNDLKFREVKERMAAGQMFDVVLVDLHSNMPDDAQIEYRLGDDAGSRTISEPMRRLGATMTASRENVQRSFSYRAVGGDDHTMGWIKLTVVEPAKLESLSVTMRPPEYTGWPQETSSGAIAALVGTKLEIRGQASKPLSAVALKHENGSSVAGRIEPDGRSFVVPASGSEPLLVKDSGSYWIELTDNEGVVGGADRRYAIRAVPDEAPTVALEKPTSDLYLTAQATVPLRILAKDRLALQAVDLHYTRSDKSAEAAHKTSLYAGPEKVPTTDKKGLAVAAEEGERRLLEHELNLAELTLPAGTQLAIHATASDYRPAVGQSPTVRVFIITPRELEERLARQQAQVLGDLARALKLEREARARVTELEIQMKQVGQLGKGDLDQLQAAELQQRDVRRMLTGSAEAARNQIAGVLEQLANNKLNSPEIQRRMGALGGMLDALERQQLPAAERELTTALKNGQIDQDRGSSVDKDAATKKDAAPKNAASKDAAPKDATPRNAETDRALSSAGQQQDQVIDALDKAISDLKRWDKYREYSRDLSGIEQRQQKAREQTADLLSKTLGRDMKDLAPQEVADLKKQAEKQAELAREFNKVVEGMQKTHGELEQSDPLAAQSLEDAMAQAAEKGVAQKMTSAASKIDQNQVAGAMRQQAEAGQGLQEMLDVLSNRREQELSRLVQKLREAEKKLADLRKEQSALRKKMQQAAKKTDPEERRREMQRLAREQQELQKEALRLARQLQRLDARKPADKLAGAGARMGKSGQQGQAGQPQQADDEAAAAEKDLEQAEQQLAQERRQAEIDLVQEQLIRLKDQLQGLRQQQQMFLDETKRLEALRDRQQRLTRGQEVSVSNLARNQAGLGHDVAQAARKLAAAEGFGLALERASADMTRAATSLARLNTGDEPQQAQKRALSRLKLVLDALQPDKPESDMEDPGGSGQPQPGAKPPQQQPPGDGIHTLQELKLLKLMQQDVRERTDAVEARKREGEPLAENDVRELGELAEEQGRLADLMLKLSEPDAPAPEDNPDKLPGADPAGDKQNEKGDSEPADGEPAPKIKEETQPVEPTPGSE